MSMIGCFERVGEPLAESLLTDTAAREEFFLKQDCPAERMDVDKAWHAIHFALTGQAWPGEDPLAQVIFGGEPFGGDLGYGPPRVLGVSDVQRVHLALAAIDPSDVAKGTDVHLLDEEDIYPGSWSSDAKGSREYIAQHLRRLRDFYGEAASKGEAVILWMS